MTKIRVFATNELGRPLVRRPVVAHLVSTSGNAAHVSGGEVLQTAAVALTDSGGVVTLDLTPNASMSPAGTYYRVQLDEAVWPIEVPVSGGPYDVGDPSIIHVDAVSYTAGPAGPTGPTGPTGWFAWRVLPSH